MPTTPPLDLDLLRAFATVADTGSFSRAAERLLRTQSTISLQIKRLEDGIGERLLDRTTKSVKLTARGETMLAYARRMLALGDEMMAKVAEPHLAGLVRLGTPEDFATSHLPGVLARFAQAYPEVVLEVTCDLTLNLLDSFRDNRFDIVLVKREPAADARLAGGVRVWREPLVWVAGPAGPPQGDRALPLVVSPPPCVYRKRAVDALDRAGRRWRVAYTCGSLAGSLAAVRAGLGMTVLPKDMVPPGLVALDGGPMPALSDTEIALLSAEPLSAPADRLRAHMIRALEQGA